MPDVLGLLSRLPRLPISTEAALILSVMVVSTGAALIALVRNRRVMRGPVDQDADLGVLFENPASIMPHIIELRKRLIISLIAIGVGTAAAAALSRQVLILLAAPIGGVEELIAIGVTEPFAVTFRVALVLGIILASPFVLAQLWIFVAAGLKRNEQRMFYLLFPFGMLLFLAGVLFAYLVMLPVAVPFLVGFLGFEATPTLENYVKFVTNVLLWVGLSFEMPLISFVLARLRVINARMLLSNWRIAIVLIAVLAALVTPTPDPVNMGIVAAPLMVLYLVSILLAAIA
ncbi:MAG: twin-arginine translocase subunit TatC [Anaerolineae bacterium]